jgi:hypothetical protein
MRIALAAIALALIWPAGHAAADPYRWCAEYGDDLGGSTSCYFVTLEQCRAAISGNGGFCRQNFYYSGPDAAMPPKKARRHD